MLNLHSLSTARKRVIFVTSFILGLFFIVQSRSFEGVEQLVIRDSASNTFREMQVLRDTNRNLLGEIDSLEELLVRTKDSSLSLKVLEEEIQKFRVITGQTSVYGPGVVVTVPDKTEVASLVDLANELFSSGAEVVSVNGVRLTRNTFGFENIPSGQILMNSTILHPPYIFAAIGESTTLENSLRQQGGIVQRFERLHPGKTLAISKKDRIDVK